MNLRPHYILIISADATKWYHDYVGEIFIIKQRWKYPGSEKVCEYEVVTNFPKHVRFERWIIQKAYFVDAADCKEIDDRPCQRRRSYIKRNNKRKIKS